MSLSLKVRSVVLPEAKIHTQLIYNALLRHKHRLRSSYDQTRDNWLDWEHAINRRSHSSIQVFGAQELKNVNNPATEMLESHLRLLRMNQAKLSVPLSWVATTEAQPAANLGDALSAVVVSTLAGLPARRANFDANCERLVAVGTIGHGQRNGILHFWGTGVDAKRNVVDRSVDRYIRPANTEFRVHALRGPNSAKTFREAGISVPEVFGDPVWMLPRIWPMEDVEKTHELGVILHISELEEESISSTVAGRYRRYAIPDKLTNKIRLINTLCEPTPAAMQDKVREILSCRRIVSTSLHGLVISETYGIPCAWFATYGDGDARRLLLDDHDQLIDHRIRDFYLGIGARDIPAYCQDRRQETNWQNVIGFIDGAWQKIEYYNASKLIDSFPLPLAVRQDDTHWSGTSEVLGEINF